MANTNFRIAGSSVSSEPSEPPVLAWPTTEGGGSVVSYPEVTRRDGLGYSCGIIGKPWSIIGRHRIGITGANFYNALFTGNVESVAVKTKLYDPRSMTWKIYDGIAQRPTIGKPISGSAYEFRDFRMTVTNLVERSGWSGS